MMETNTISRNIITRIRKLDPQEVFVASDFVDLADINTVRQILSRQELSGKIHRVLRGVYYCPEYSKILKEFEAPSPQKVADAFARKYGWTIAPSGSTALNILGLSTQVSAKWNYISDGPYKVFKIGNLELEFKHRSNKDISGLSFKTATVIQALKTLGKEHVDDEVINRLRKLLTEKDKDRLLKEAKQSTSWVYEIIKKICKRTDVYV